MRKLPIGLTLEALARKLIALDVGQTGDAVPLQPAVQCWPCQMRDRRLQRIEAIVERQKCVTAECYDRCLPGLGQGRGVRGLRPVVRSSTVAHLRHFATVFGLITSSRLNVESEAYDRCIAALTACVVVAFP